MHYSPDTFENIVSLLPGYVSWKDKNHIYLGCNSLQAKSLGLASRYDIVGKTDYDLIWKDQAEEIKRIEQQVIETGDPVTVEEEVRIINQPRAIFLSKKTPLRNEQGAVIGVMGVSIDITKQRDKQNTLLLSAERQFEAANQAKTEFIHNVEHDIRTPFAGIITVAQYLRSKEDDNIKRNHLTEIADSAQHLLNYFNEILEVSYQTSGELAIVEKKFDIREINSELMAIQRPSSNSKNIKLLQEYADDLPTTMIGDRFRIERILLNLISNAIKFTDKGYVQVSVEIARKIDLKNIILKISVEDSGIGIEQHNISRIFDKFSRITPAYKGIYNGTGMGLYLVKRFIEDLGGEIEVKSVVDKGTTFTCLIPLKIPLLTEEKYQLVELDSM